MPVPGIGHENITEDKKNDGSDHWNLSRLAFVLHYYYQVDRLWGNFTLKE